jgi:hypothetical protein
MRTRSLLLMVALYPVTTLGQDAYIGLRLSGDHLFIRKWVRSPEVYETGYDGMDICVLHGALGMSVTPRIQTELRAGYGVVGPYDGWEVGLIGKIAILDTKFQVLASYWLHWNRGGYGGMTSTSFKTLFHAPGIGIGWYDGGHWSAEIMVLRPFGGELGSTTRWTSTPPEIKPTRISWVIRAGVGYILQL